MPDAAAQFSASAGPGKPHYRDWFGHPPGLTILFLTESWEKFSYYGMRALLVYYMTKQLMFAQGRASFIYGMYTAFVYLFPVVGGLIADRWLGRRTAVIVGGSVMAAGHFMMAFEGLFFPALITIALGNGLYLPSLPAQVSSLYAEDDPRRNVSYTVYYIGINLGAFLAPLVCGTLGEVYGWHYGFGAAGVGMLLGVATYIYGGKYLPAQPLQRKQQAPVADSRWTRTAVRDRFVLLFTIALVVCIFRAAYEQLGNTVALWADVGIDRAVTATLSVPMTWFQSLNALVVFTLAPMLVGFWVRRAAQGRDSSPVFKMAMGSAGVALAYFALAAVSAWAESNGVRAHWMWLAAFVVLLSTAELWILPVGLGLFGRLAPSHLAATAFAAWFVAAFGGNLLGGALGSYWSVLSHSAFFAMIGGVALSAAALLMMFERPVRRADVLDTEAGEKTVATIQSPLTSSVAT